MRIGFYAPFKPLNHSNPSGDLIIASGLVDRLTGDGHEVRLMSGLRARWIYWKPWSLIRTVQERSRIRHGLRKQPIDLWLTYHSYYKAPDLLGPTAASENDLPYVIFQGIYSTRVSKHWRTRPGFILNRRALRQADLVLTNRQDDLINLRRLMPENRLRYFTPGIEPRDFTFDPAARERMRQKWKSGERPVILTAAMFRPDVKTEGLIRVIESCARLLERGFDFHLVIAGSGSEKKRLTTLASRLLGRRAHFAGLVPRNKMHELYSGGDLFVFPGINESLGMVFLEAQSCGLPVVAYHTGGIPEVVKPDVTGLLTSPDKHGEFDEAVAALLLDPDRRRKMGGMAAELIRERHDLTRNYETLAAVLERTVQLRQQGRNHA